MSNSRLLVTLYHRCRPLMKWYRYSINHNQFFGFKQRLHSKGLSCSSQPVAGIIDAGSIRSTIATAEHVSSETRRVSVNYENFLLAVESASSEALNEDSALPALESNIAKLTEDEILDFIASSYRVRSTSDNDKVSAVIRRLENECIRRARSWDIDTFTNFYARYREIGFAPHSRFPAYALRSRCKYVFNHCSLPVILEFLRLLHGTLTKRKVRFNHHDVEYILNEHLDVLQPDQVASFIYLLSASGKNLRNDRLKKKLCIWFVSQAQTLPEDVVRGFVSLFAGSDATNPLFITPWLVRALKAIEGRLNEFEPSCLSAVALTCSRMMLIDRVILEKIASKLLSELSATDLRDVESIVEALVSLNFRATTCDFYNDLTERMCRQPLYDELRRRPRSLCRILAQLSFIDVYPYRLLSCSFSKECLQRGYKRLSKYNVPYEIRMLLGGLRVERPDYRGCKLGFNLVRYHTRKHRLSFPKALTSCEEPTKRNERDNECRLDAPRELSPYNRLLYSATILLNHIFGSAECTHVCFVLPHSSRANILFVTDKTKQPRQLLPNVRSDLLLQYRHLDWSDSEYYVVAFRSKNTYTDYEPTLMGEEIAKTRQMQKLGFRIVTLTQHGWFKMHFQQALATLKETLQQEGITVVPRPEE